MVVQIVRFGSGLSDEDVVRVYEERVPRYRELPRPRRKIHLRFGETGEDGAVSTSGRARRP
jgi:hypothetical protein